MPNQSVEQMKHERRHVTRTDMAQDFAALGLASGDVVMVHSSLSSIGYVTDGPDAVIDALLEVVGETGTVIMPTLVRGGLTTEERFEIWDIDNSPSDVGRITEVFRQRPESIRSWHPTHAASAIGPLAHELTKDHKHASGRPSPWHDAAFAADSPWEKMCDLGAKYMFLGTNYRTCTVPDVASRSGIGMSRGRRGGDGQRKPVGSAAICSCAASTPAKIPAAGSLSVSSSQTVRSTCSGPRE